VTVFGRVDYLVM